MVTIVCGSSPPGVELCRQGSEAWAKSRGHEVRVLGQPESSNRARDLLTELLAVGTADLDVVEVDMVWPGVLAPHLLDLTDRLEGVGPFFQGAVGSFSVGGRLLAAPWSLSVGRLFYRKDLLERYRLPVPATWEELAASARQIQEGERAAGRNEFWGYLWQGRVGEGLTVNVFEWLASRDLPLVLDPGGGFAGLERPETAAVLDQAPSWIDTISPAAVLDMGEQQSFAAFTAGNAAYLRYWSSGLELAEAEDSAVRGKVATAELPAGDNASGRHTGVLGGSGLAVVKNSKVQDLAVDLVRWLAGPDEQRRRAMAGGYDPSLPALYDDPALTARWPHLPALRPAIEQAVLRPTEAAGSGYGALSDAFASGVHAILKGEVGAGPGLKALAEELRRVDAANRRGAS